MKVIKPQRLSVLARTFEHEGAFHFAVSVLAFFPFERPSQLLSEVAMWKFLPTELGKDAALDLGMPKSRAEVLLTAKAYPAGGKPQAACPVRLRLGKVDKSLYAVGDRFWKGGMPSTPRPFTASAAASPATTSASMASARTSTSRRGMLRTTVRARTWATCTSRSGSCSGSSER